MRIKKRNQSVGILGKILSIFSNSNDNTYSCDYINKTYGGGVKDYSTEEVKLDEKWIDGKPIYKKVYSKQANNTNEISIKTDETIDFIVNMNIFLVSADGGRINIDPGISVSYSAGNKFNSGQYIGKGSSWNPNHIYIPGNIIMNGTVYAILEYTKTTD